jgi:hypothetical protein
VHHCTAAAFTLTHDSLVALLQTNADSITALWATILKLDEEFDARGRRQGEDEEESRENGDGGEDEYDDYRYAEGDQPTKAKALREVLLKVPSL